MVLTQEYRELIEEIIKKNPRYKGNEDLAEDFCSETFKRTYNLISSIKDKSNIDMYLHKVASSAILEVLRSAGRLTRTRDGYKKRVEISLTRDNNYPKDEQGYLAIEIQDPFVNVEEEIIENEEINQIKDYVILLNKKYPEKEYLKLFNLRYYQEKTQLQIAEELDLSQSEVSKRLVQLTKRVTVLLNNIEVK